MHRRCRRWLYVIEPADLPRPAALPRLPDRPTLPALAITQPRAAVANAPSSAQAVGGTGCVVCSRLPAVAIPVRRQVGLVFVRQTAHSSAALCREHGMKRARSFLVRTLIQGWWGIISFFVNFIAISTDLAAMSQYKRLPPPQGVVRLNRSAFAPPAPFGSKRRLLTLVWIVLGIVVVGALVGFIGAAIK